MNASPAVLLLVAAAATAQVVPPSALKYPPLRPVELPQAAVFTLSNGIRLYLVEDHELPLINGFATVRTGTLFDPPDKVGLAAMTGEVLRTGGAAGRSGDQVNELLENLAGNVESTIAQSSGTVTFAALKDNAAEVFQVFHDVLTAPEFRQDRIDLAKTRFRTAIAHRNDDPIAVLRREFPAMVYGKDSPYGWALEYAHIDRISRGDLFNFHGRYFFPKNVMLAVWGDFETAKMKDSIEKLFASWTAEQPPVPEFPKVTGRGAPGTFLAQKKDAQQTFFALGELGSEAGDKDYAALEILARILGGGTGSRLYRRIVADMGNATSIAASWIADFDHPGLFEITGALKPLPTVETLKAVQEETARIRESEVTDEELKAARDTALNSLVFALDTKTKAVRQLMTYAYFGYPSDFLQRYQKALESVTRADVLRAARERLDPAGMTLVVVTNPIQLQRPLDALGSPVIPIDLTILPPRPEAAKGDAASRQRGQLLLARAQQAVGGAEKLATVKDYTQEATHQLDVSVGGLVVPETDRWIAPSYFRQDTVVPAGKISAYIDGRAGWIATSQGSGPLMGTQLKQVQGDLFRIFFTMLLSDRAPGRTVNAVDAATVEIGDDSGHVVRLVMDSESGLPAQVLYDNATATGEVPVLESYSDYREVGGLRLPFQMEIVAAGRKYSHVTVKQYLINSGLKVEDLEKRP